MPKYSEKNVLKIKKDVERFSKKLGTLNEKIKEANTDLANVRKIVEAYDETIKVKQDAILDLEKKHELTMQKFLQDKSLMIVGLNELEKDRINLVNKIKLLKEEVANARSEHNSEMAYLGSVGSTLKEDLSVIVDRIERGSELYNKIQKSKENLANAITNLKKNKSILEKKVLILDKEIGEKEGDVSHLLSEKERLADTLADIERREHDAKVMELRLSDEYLRVYKSLPNRRKKDVL